MAFSLGTASPVYDNNNEDEPMASVICPSCSSPNSPDRTVCEQCGARLREEPVAPIRKFSGKLSAIGAVILAIALIGTALGAWWGPGTMLPGIAFLMMAKFL